MRALLPLLVLTACSSAEPPPPGKKPAAGDAAAPPSATQPATGPGTSQPPPPAPPEPPLSTWRWQNPTPSGAMLTDVHGSSAKDLYIVGAAGTILHSIDGGVSFRRETSNVWQSLASVHAVDAKEAYAVGTGGTIVHTADGGATWTTEDGATTQRLASVWAAASGDVFAVGAAGTALRRRGGRWAAMTVPTTAYLYQVWGDKTALLIVGDAGTVLRSTNGGDTWEAVAVGTTDGISSIWGDGAGFVVAHAPYLALISRDSGATFTTSKTPEERPVNLWGSSAEDIYAAGRYATLRHSTDGGLTWQLEESPRDVSFFGVWGSGAADVYVVGEGGTILHSDGKAWALATRGHPQGLTAIWGAGAKLVVVGRSGTVLKSGDAGATWARRDAGTTADLLAVWGFSDKQAWAAGGIDVVVTADGGDTWARLPSLPVDVEDISGVSPSDIHVVGVGGAILHSTDGGGSFSPEALPAAMPSRPARCRRAPEGSPPGTPPVCPPPVPARLYGVCAVGPGETYAVGDLGTILHESGGVWSVQASGVTSVLHAVWADASGNGVVVGDGGVVLRKDGGGSWRHLDTPPAERWLDVLRRGDAVTVVGTGMIRSTDAGKSFRVETLETRDWLRGVHADSGGIWVVGERGVILQAAK